MLKEADIKKKIRREVAKIISHSGDCLGSAKEMVPT